MLGSGSRAATSETHREANFSLPSFEARKNPPARAVYGTRSLPRRRQEVAPLRVSDRRRRGVPRIVRV